MERRDGVDFLSETTLTTISGRQAQINNTENLTIVASIDQSQQGSGGGAGGGGGGSGFGGGQGGGTGVAAGVNFPTTQLSTGPVLDVIPYVSADGYTIQMTILPTIVEFLGYDDPGPFLPQVQSVAGSAVGVPLTSVLPLPRTRVRYVMTSVMVWDGQTVVLGGLISENVQKVKDKVPFLGDIPIIGKLFRSEGAKTVKKNLVIFVTPTIIDPAGNRRNDPDNPRYDPSTYSIPDQATSVVSDSQVRQRLSSN
jgi:general secretion pathway protein D